LRSGDIVFQDSSPTSTVQAGPIKKLTRSDYSHCGIYFERAGLGPVVVEAVGRSRKYLPWEQWRRKGTDGEVTVRRLNRALTQNELEQLWRKSISYAGRTYDIKFAWDNEAIYCSELVWKSYRDALGIEIGKVQRLGDFDLESREGRILTERPGSWGSVAAVPRDEKVVSPQAVLESRHLQ
jgi:uncharacterized protein YycO